MSPVGITELFVCVLFVVQSIEIHLFHFGVFFVNLHQNLSNLPVKKIQLLVDISVYCAIDVLNVSTVLHEHDEHDRLLVEQD